MVRRQAPRVGVGVAAPSELEVGQALGLVGQPGGRVDEVIAARLLVRHRHREEQALLVVEPVVQAQLRVEEIKRRAVPRHVDHLLVVVGAVGLVPHPAVLQFGLGLQPCVPRPLHEPHEGVVVRLDPGAVVVAIARTGRHRGVARPDDLSEMVAVVAVPRPTQRQPRPLPIPLRADHTPVEIVVQPTAAHQVGRADRVAALDDIRQVVVGEVVARLELLEIPLSVGEVTGQRHPPIADQLLEVELLVVLAVVVDLVLVGVVVRLPAQIDEVINLRLGIVVRLSPSLDLLGRAVQRDFRHAPPTLVGALPAAHQRVGHPAPIPFAVQRELEAAQVARRPVHPSVAHHRADAALGRPAAGTAPGVPREVGPERIETATPDHHRTAGLLSHLEGIQGNGRPKGTRSQRRRTHATLDLDVVGAAGEVGHVDPENGLRFAVVDGDAVERHIDPCWVRAAYAQARIAHAGSGVGGDDD